MLCTATKDAYLCELGFTRISLYRSWDYPVGNGEAAFIPITDVRYLHQTVAADGTRLYAYAWVEEPGILLTTERHISALEHIVAELETDDFQVLSQQIDRFFQRHGGRGVRITSAVHCSQPMLS
ncbi:hypothetical protein [Hymenobacter metallilatus]|uniref:Uncharacterized protein n=1 Tax=Hymenobacter metallilatus TaxID=2493666 RepID=A0A3R9NU80_9BACT|nr:hypothetical protein [Hymenobacter metallilatus]RSK37686.1 hypothetical protein EI290_03330 [Hymenobacter metallilatus]